MGEGLNVSVSEARKLLRDILETNSICVVVTLASKTEAIVVTAWRIRR